MEVFKMKTDSHYIAQKLGKSLEMQSNTLFDRQLGKEKESRFQGLK